MSVADRWHTRKPRPGAQLCRQHKMWPSAEHGQGDRWQVRWKDPDTGKQHSANRPRKAGADPDMCADAYDTKIHADIQAGTYTDPAAGQIILEAYAKQWRAALTVDPASLETIDNHLAHIFDVEAGPRSKRAPGRSPIGKLPMALLSKRPSLIQAWVKHLQAKRDKTAKAKPLSARYISQVTSTLSTIFKAAIADGIVARNPVEAKQVNPPAVQRREVVPWPKASVVRARVELGRRIAGGAAMVTLGAGAGLREGEVWAVSEDQVDFLHRIIHVRRQVKRVRDPLTGKMVLGLDLPKRGKTRDVPMSQSVGFALAASVEELGWTRLRVPWLPTGELIHVKLLFVKKDGRPWYRGPFQYHWDRTVEGAGMAGILDNDFHGLRHTYASVQLAAGVDVRKLARWLGHDDPGFTLRTYAHFMPDTADVGRKAIDAFLAEDGGGEGAASG